jgi:hypothetical protein
MSFQEEAFLAKFAGGAAEASVLVAGEIRAAWEARLGRPVHKSTLYTELRQIRRNSVPCQGDSLHWPAGPIPFDFPGP